MTKTTKIIIWLVVAVIVIGGIWYGVGRKPAEEGVIKIGVSIPLTGEAASWGQNALAGITLVTNEFNEKGGIKNRKIELVVEDNQCTSEGGITSINKLVNVDRVNAVLGPLCSTSAGSSLPFLQNNGIPTIFMATAPDLPKIGDYVFRVFASDSYQGKFSADFVFNELNKEKVALVYVANEQGEGLRAIFREEFEKLGGVIVYEAGVSQNERDFKTIITKIKKSDAEALYLPIYPANAVAVLKQINEMSLNLPLIGSDAFAGEEVIGSGYAEGLLYPLLKTGLSDEFKTKINSLPGYQDLKVHYVSTIGYDSAKVLYLAMERAGTDMVKIKDELTKTSTPGKSSARIEFDENGDIKTADFQMMVIRDKNSLEYR